MKRSRPNCLMSLFALVAMTTVCLMCGQIAIQGHSPLVGYIVKLSVLLVVLFVASVIWRKKYPKLVEILDDGPKSKLPKKEDVIHL